MNSKQIPSASRSVLIAPLFMMILLVLTACGDVGGDVTPTYPVYVEGTWSGTCTNVSGTLTIKINQSGNEISGTWSHFYTRFGDHSGYAYDSKSYWNSFYTNFTGDWRYDGVQRNVAYLSCDVSGNSASCYIIGDRFCTWFPINTNCNFSR